MKYAVILSAGKGTRMGSVVPKQYLELLEKPVIYFALKAFEDSIADKIVLVCGEGDENFCKKNIIEKYGIKKNVTVVTGGAYRFESVYNGIKALGDITEGDCIAVHDGARPVITPEMINMLYEKAEQNGSAVAASPVKDTIKQADCTGKVLSTPDRAGLWQVQTPQVFNAASIKAAYEEMMKIYDTSVTDDAMVMEKYGSEEVYLCDTGYLNIKITTPEDLDLAKLYIKKSINPA